MVTRPADEVIGNRTSKTAHLDPFCPNVRADCIPVGQKVMTLGLNAVAGIVDGSECIMQVASANCEKVGLVTTPDQDAGSARVGIKTRHSSRRNISDFKTVQGNSLERT